MRYTHYREQADAAKRLASAFRPGVPRNTVGNSQQMPLG
jgi:hypothetical protein